MHFEIMYYNTRLLTAYILCQKPPLDEVHEVPSNVWRGRQRHRSLNVGRAHVLVQVEVEEGVTVGGESGEREAQCDSGVAVPLAGG